MRNVDQMKVSISFTNYQKLSLQAHVNGVHISFWKRKPLFIYTFFFKMYIYLYFTDASKRFSKRFLWMTFYAATQMMLTKVKEQEDALIALIKQDDCPVSNNKTPV